MSCRELELEQFLRRTAMHGGSIVSSTAMTATQIAVARAADRMLVMPDGYGFVYVPGPAACGSLDLDDDLLRAYSAAVTEGNRLLKLFDDAGQGEHNVLALIEHYQRNSMDADQRFRAVRELLEENGCDCSCDHSWEDHNDDCERCLACRIEKVLRE